MFFSGTNIQLLKPLIWELNWGIKHGRDIWREKGCVSQKDNISICTVRMIVTSGSRLLKTIIYCTNIATRSMKNI